MRTFNHKLDTPFGFVNIDKAQGFTDCLGEVLKYIEKTTGFDPKKRFIDSVQLIEVIQNTNNELAEILNKQMEDVK